MEKKVVDELSAIVGEEFVSTRQDVLLTYSASASIGYDRVMPAVVVRPSSAEEISPRHLG